MTDLLTSIKLEPNGLIGHSFGEIICGYADKCLSKKQALLAAYYRGLASTETNTIKALMAVIGTIYRQERFSQMKPRVNVETDEGQYFLDLLQG